MGKRLSIEYVREQFEKEGYKLLSKRYINNASKLEYECPNGHLHSIRFEKWARGTRCYYCNLDNKRNNFDTIKEVFDNEGYTLLSYKYTNNRTKLDYMCSNGHKYRTTYNNWNAGYRCPYCSNCASPSIHYIGKEFAKRGYKLLSTEYKNAHTKLDYICSNEHKHSIKWNDFQQGYGCRFCQYDLLSSLFRGENGPGWQGGTSQDPYCDVFKNKEYRSYLKERDNNTCQNPYCFHNSDKLVLHHIDYDKQNNHFSNLITICNACNLRANKDREWHTEWYQTLMRNKYGYEYKKGE